MLETRIISSLEKCFSESSPADFAPLERISVLRGERLSFQYAYRETAPDAPHRTWCTPVLLGDLAEFASVRIVEFTPSLMPVYPPPRQSDDDFLKKDPGLYPDRLEQIPKCGIPVCTSMARTLWITVDIPADASAGDHTLTVGIDGAAGPLDRAQLVVHIVAASLPEQTMPVTQWFHCDCLADYYRVPVFSEEHWRIIENFVHAAVSNGINTLLTPLFTPPLDTAIGHERPTVQLVGVTLEGGKYSFDYSLLDRWIDMCDRVGVKYFEINHLFTQWGAAFAPKVMATVDGEYRRIFGWDTPAADGEYPVFLRTFLPDFIAHMKSRGDDRRCIFHISDEPNSKNLEQYTRSRAVVADLLEGYTVMDALSNIEFWQSGVVRTPVVATNHIQPFIDVNVPDLWAYYCCSQSVGVSNRFFAMPGARTRFIGMQFYKYNIAGFLQWGYNFYYNQGSYNFVDPYADSTGQYFAPSGDTYSVYPARDGTATESVRIVQFHEALQDARALALCEKLCGREATLVAMEAICGEIVFHKCVCDSPTLLALRDKVNHMIEQKV
ncbi:MAG: DUF4091 domain-containing protein [Clostridia bacterium]|nr:DUF4091 domain-containing protein [Clostridia bacterium]